MILAFDTSLRDLQIGLFSDNAEPLAEVHHKAPPDSRGIQDVLLAQETAALLSKISAPAKDISKIALIIGPGSFTGLRIGLSFAKGLAFGSGAALIPLKAHTVLVKSYEKEYSVSDDLAILYPSYESHKTYLSHAHSPEHITHLTIEEVKKMGIEKIICLPEFEGREFTKTIISIDLKIMAELAIGYSPSSIGEIEPFYGVDFTVRKP